MAMTGGTAVHLKSAYFPGSNNKQQIHLYGYYKITSDTASSKVISVGMYIYSTGSGWNFGPWTNYGSYMSCGSVISGSSQYDSTTQIPSTTTTAYWVFENKTFTVSAQASSASIGWKLACNPSSWLGDTSWNRPSGTFNVPLTPYYSSCGAPTNLSVSDNGSNVITLSCKVGSNGTHNAASSVDLYVTYNGTAPSTSNYTRTYNIAGTAGTTITITLDFNGNTESDLSSWLGSDFKGPIKFTARTRGAAGSSYYSGTATAASGDLTWYSRPSTPVILTPPSTGATAIAKDPFTFSWSSSTAGRNNAVASYLIEVYDCSTSPNTRITSVSVSNDKTSHVFPAGTFVGGKDYLISLYAVGTKSNFNSNQAISGVLTVIAATGLPNFSASVSDEAFTVPKTSILGQETFVTIGTGTIAKLQWTDPDLDDPSDLVGYDINISHPILGYILWTESLGKVNHFYIRADQLLWDIAPWERSTIDEFQIVITAKSKYGSEFDSYSSVYIPITYGTGAYVDVQDPESATIVPKRALAFIKVTDSAGQSVWKLANTGYHKNTANNTWQSGDISYELLQDSTGDIIYDKNNEPIFTL